MQYMLAALVFTIPALLFFFQTFIACCLFEPLGLMVMNLYRYFWLIPKYIGQDNMMESAAGWVDIGECFGVQRKDYEPIRTWFCGG